MNIDVSGKYTINCSIAQCCWFRRHVAEAEFILHEINEVAVVLWIIKEVA